jgi:predicted ATPase/DNA-binding SARP family transcriptional activator
VRIGVLGALEVWDAGGGPVAVGGPRPRALLALLAVDANRVVSLDAIVAAQYGDDPPADAAGAVQAHVSRLRKAVAGVVFEGGGYRLVIEPDDVDALRFERLAGEGRRLLAAGAHDRAAAVLREAIGLWRGPALVDLPHGEARAARLDELRLAAFEDLVEAELALPAGTSVAELRALVAANPLRERLRGQLMRALHATGRQAEALAEFEDTRRLLADELGADPSPELSDTHLAILRAAPAPRRVGVPAQLTSFVGRDAELGRLRALCALRDSRLVTILGPGGTGKTRLAIEAVRGRDVCFADLSPVSSGDLVPHAVLGALGVRESGFLPAAGDPVRRLVLSIGREPLLLVLDNCEQVVASAAALARTLLAECPSLTILATSREPLGLTGETLLPLAPLATVAALAAFSSEAVRLFADRAAAVRPGFTVTDANRDAVAAVCAAVDGLPLAVELAAARLRQFTVEELAERLASDGPFRLLSRGDRTAAARHRTLRAVVAWSWDLLTPAEQAVAARFAVFTGGASLAAVEAVCDTTDDVLADLVDRSLIETDGRRYRMLDTVRLFCAEHLPDDTRRAHAEYYLALARRADPHLRRAEQLDWLATLSADHDNLMAALRWSVHGDPATGYELMAALTAYWWLSGRRGEVSEVALALLDRSGDAGEGYVACVLHARPREPLPWTGAREVMRGLTSLRYPFVAAVLGMTTGPWEPAESLLGSDPWSLALGRLSLAIMRVLDGEPSRGEAELREVLGTFRDLGERWGMAQALDWLGEVAGWRGEWDRARALWAESLAHYERFGALEECVDVLCRRADCLLRQGDVGAAEADFRRADELNRRAGQPPSPAVLLGLATITGSGLAEAMAATSDDFAGIPVLAQILTATGRHAEAVATARRSPFAAPLAAAVEGLASAAPAARAAFLLGTAVALRGTTVANDPLVAATAARATKELGETGFAAAYADGARQTREQALTTLD